MLRAEGYAERALFVIDKLGLIRYIDVHDINEQPDNEVLFGVLAELEPELSAQYAATVKAAEASAKPVEPIQHRGEVVIYCTPWCPGCRRARIFLQEHKIPFVEIDISRDRTAAARVRGWAYGYETTPTFDINGSIIVDFNPVKLSELLGIKEK